MNSLFSGLSSFIMILLIIVILMIQFPHVWLVEVSLTRPLFENLLDFCPTGYSLSLEPAVSREE